MIAIKQITALSDYKLKVLFEDNRSGICDITPFLGCGAFQELKEQSLFCAVKNQKYSVEWPNEVDLSSDTLRHIMVG